MLVLALAFVVFLPAAVAAVLVGWWFRMRLQTMSVAIGDLAQRVRVLEEVRPTAARSVEQPASVAAVAVAVPAPIPQPRPAPVAAVTLKTPAIPPRPLREIPRETLETRIGSRWLLYAGILAIIVGASYFEKLAIDNHWINETARVIQGALVGGLFIAGGLAFVRKGYERYGQILSGCGIAILYVSTYAAFNFYHLIGHGVAFALMIAITLLAAWLADRQSSQGLAVVAVGGGFLTPFLLPSNVDAEVALFGYVAMLIAGTALLSRRRDWPILNVVSYSLTIVTALLWAAAFYRPAKYLTTELFLTLFCGLFLYILTRIVRAPQSSGRLGRNILWTSPFLYHLVSLVVLWDHPTAFLVYLAAWALTGAVISATSWVRFGFWAAVAMPLLVWSSAPVALDRPGTALSAWTFVYLLNLAGLYVATRSPESRFDPPDIALLHANGLVAFAGAYSIIARLDGSAGAPLAVGFALINGALCYHFWNRRREQALHFAAVAFTFLTIAAGLKLRGVWVMSAWAAEGALVAWLGLRERREWLRIGGLLLLAIAVAQLVGLQFSAAPVDQLVLLNRRTLSGLFVVGLTYALSEAHERHRRRTDERSETGVALVLVANVLTMMLVTSEIVTYWTNHDMHTFSSTRSSYLAKEMSLSIAWAVYATLLVVAGFKRRYAQIRYLAIGVFLVTIGKVLVIDLAETEAVYRVLSVVGLGVTLLVTSYFYQRFSAEASRRL